MQIRKKGRKLLLIRTQYVADKKRTIGKTIASLNRYSLTYIDIPADVLSILTREECQQLENWLENEATTIAKSEIRYALQNASESLSNINKALLDDQIDISSDQATMLYVEMNAIAQSLRARNFKKKDLLAMTQ